jgi:hypothetical protein
MNMSPGFYHGASAKIGEMLLFKDINKQRPNR